MRDVAINTGTLSPDSFLMQLCVNPPSSSSYILDAFLAVRPVHAALGEPAIIVSSNFGKLVKLHDFWKIMRGEGERVF